MTEGVDNTDPCSEGKEGEGHVPRAGGGPWKAKKRPISECVGFDEQIHRHMKHKDSEKMVSGVILFGGLTHIHAQ